MTQQTSLDKLVGKVAGAICICFMEHPDIHNKCLILSPGVTFKVKSCLAKYPTLKELPDVKRQEIVREIQNSVISLLFTYEIDPVKISSFVPSLSQIIEKSLFEEIPAKPND